MNNPYGNDPRTALWPDPPGCAGWRLWKMLEQETGATKRQYIKAFERENLCVGQWNMEEARSKMFQLIVNNGHLNFILVGNDVWRAYSSSPKPLPFTWSHNVAWIPHPSGRNRLYNDSRIYLSCVYFMAECYFRSVGLTVNQPVEGHNAVS
jgi:hypothetical protein